MELSIAPTPNPPRPERLESVDLLRGVVMVIMALDHVRDHFSSVDFDPLDLTQTTPALFLTRWISHFCAPVFVFLAGVGAGLSRQQGRSTADLASFLVSRGAWLVFLEFTVIAFGWRPTLQLDLAFLLQVIWALGASMIVLGGLVFLPRWAIATFALAMIGGHNLTDGFRPEDFGVLGPIWAVLHVPSETQLARVTLYVAYPLVPWIGVMAAGYLCAPVFGLPPLRARRWLAGLGVAALLAFVVLRAVNAYGEPRAWVSQPTAVATALAFVDTTKYPPSLLYLLMTLGPALVALACLGRSTGGVARFFVTFGRVPLFFYVLHLYLIHLFAVGAGTLQGFAPSAMLNFFLRFPSGYGFDLPVVYAVWFVVIGILYGPCAWFAAVKHRRREPWLSYL